MLFSEVYGTYYNVLAKLLEKAVEGTLTRESMNEIIREKGFEESILTIPEALENQTWPLIKDDFTSPLEHTPTMPLTTLQKRWLKALLNDPRIQLFDPPMDGLEDVEPLYPPNTFVYYDRYHDGDPFDDPGYIRRFQTILTALREKKWLRLHFLGRNNVPHFWRCIPYKLEYSAKDDKFRLISANKRSTLSINLARIDQCFLLEPCKDEEYRPLAMKKRILVLELTDDRNALERVMLHFSHLDRETERIDDKHYKITLYYEREDETELLIRVLSFGPVLKVIFPDDFVKNLVYRLEKQNRMRTQT
jgi:hypothetical protein